ncbi:EDD domain protein, DegV family [Desulfotomaculum arcticum]|uniref:EDD domain protein, DegV family n=1 Tax=Desulfotruncus arcticus DSM 17038 TaxID=1121424 RepID=A0A1I2Z2B9_9FIRM|nr:DegV family protein [Desulfotruncus arcticus]SFH31964.1 EDD domain protein, DegV family [Desulfotomaculum arcticum] [Desulfotruncus arcticus DSM 17038]
MSKVHIVTDSTADLPKQLVDQYDISVVPLKVFFGSECFLDGVELNSSDFFTRLARSKELPTTSQPSPAEFTDFYRTWVDNAADIVSIHISAHMSGTMQSAQLAKKMLDYEGLEVVDSQSVSIVLGMMVLAAARAAAAGLSREEIMTLLRNIMSNHRVYFMVDTLEYLQRGGRIGRAQAFLGTVLNVKPVLTIREGLIHPHEKIRGRKKAINRLVQLMSESYGDSPLFCFLTHGNDLEGLQALQDLVKSKLNCVEIMDNRLGSVVGTHVGPGLLGLAVCPYKYVNF